MSKKFSYAWRGKPLAKRALAIVKTKLNEADLELAIQAVYPQIAAVYEPIWDKPMPLVGAKADMLIYDDYDDIFDSNVKVKANTGFSWIDNAPAHGGKIKLSDFDELGKMLDASCEGCTCASVGEPPQNDRTLQEKLDYWFPTGPDGCLPE